ncbi:MAG: peptide chain release factor N(5)-glutamine methyltransferase [Candidatus Neomarinimicrobiota bacterium]
MTAGGDSKTWRVIDLINWGTDYFRRPGFEQPRREIEWLLGEFLNCKRLDLYLRFEEPFTAEMLTRFRGWVKRRINHEPLQYISGKTEFYGLPFAVNPAVLIPRPETERLVALALELIRSLDRPRILDVGTGSGCIAIALTHEYPVSEIVAVDISERALELARSNAAANGVAVEFAALDILQAQPAGKFDLLISNPPYVTPAELAQLQPEVASHEPQSALTDGADGLVFYRRFRDIAGEIINPGGWLVLEVGRGDHPRRAAELFAGAAFGEVKLIKDFNGDDRVLKVRING